MEMHLVHQSSDLESATNPDVEDGLTVSAFLWEVIFLSCVALFISLFCLTISEEDNAELTPIIEKLSDLVDYDSETELDEGLNVFIDVDTSTLLIIKTLDPCLDCICNIWIILQLPWIPHHTQL